MRKIQSQVQSYLKKEFSAPWREYTLSSLSEADRLKVRREEASLAAEEISWLARRYGNGHPFDLTETRARLLQTVERMPKADDPDVRLLVAQSFNEYVRSEGFNFYLEAGDRKRLLQELAAGALENHPGVARKS
jgi:hypothetical protein